jgi:DNA repair photolyase
MGSAARRPNRAAPLRVLRPFDPWQSELCTCPFKYSLNPYTGCSFMCLYCYATAYIGVKKSTPKPGFLRNLLRDLQKVPPNEIINLGTSSDPYPPEEGRFRLTRQALEILVPLGRRLLITTKGTLVTRDVDLLAAGNVAVTPTITMLDAKLSRLVEPGAPDPSDRIEALRVLKRAGVPVGVRVDPIIPFVNDDPADIEELVCKIAEAGASFIVTSTYKARPDNLQRMRRGLGDLGERIYRLYRSQGVWVRGYLYLPRRAREGLLKPVIKAASSCGLEYATCREGLISKEWFNAPSCDGSHLIPRRIPPKPAGGLRLDGWLKGDATD